MGKWKIHTPEGVQDILFEECYLKRSLEGKVRDTFRSYGFMEIETPSLEFYDTFAAEGDLIPQEAMFKFYDQQGRILVLRPEVTIPAARVAATKFREIEGPLRFSYVGNTFTYNELGGGKQKEFTQAGVELIGAASAEADAEVIALAIKAVKSTGLESFQIDIGQVEFFKGLMEETGLSLEDTEQMRVLIDRKDYLGVEELVCSYEIREELKELILSLPKLFGSLDVIDRVEKFGLNSRSTKALENLREVLSILEDYGLSKYVSIDLGMVQSLNYYSGLIFRGFTYGIGFPILSGGRYDRLVEKYGGNSPAVGFSLGINMIMMAIDRQKLPIGKPSIDSLVLCGKMGRRTAYEVCEELRRQGLIIQMDIMNSAPEKLKEYAKSKGIGGIINILDEENLEIFNIESGETTRTTIKELLNK